MVYKQEVCYLMKNVLIINGDADETNRIREFFEKQHSKVMCATRLLLIRMF